MDPLSRLPSQGAAENIWRDLNSLKTYSGIENISPCSMLWMPLGFFLQYLVITGKRFYRGLALSGHARLAKREEAHSGMAPSCMPNKACGASFMGVMNDLKSLLIDTAKQHPKRLQA